MENTDAQRRNPKLSTILMVEGFLQENQDRPMKLAEIKRQLPKKMMHRTLKVTLEYLWQSKKIEYGPEGIQWAQKSATSFS